MQLALPTYLKIWRHMWMLPNRLKRLGLGIRDSVRVFFEDRTKLQTRFEIFHLYKSNKIKRLIYCSSGLVKPRITDTQWRHKSKKSENLGWCVRQNMLQPYLKIWEWEWIFERAVKTISSPGVRSLWVKLSDTCWFRFRGFPDSDIFNKII
jgi:hypothetical protein